MAKRIYRFSQDVSDWQGDAKSAKATLGGKGAGLVMMAGSGFPVPQGFTITTDVCNEIAKLSENPAPQMGVTHTVDAEGNVIPIAAQGLDQDAEEDGEEEAPAKGFKPGKPGMSTPKKAPKTGPTKNPTPVAKTEARGVVALAMDTMIAMRKRDAAELSKNMKLVQSLDEKGFDAFRKAASSLQFVDPSLDVDGLAELTGCTLAVMHAQSCDHTH